MVQNLICLLRKLEVLRRKHLPIHLFPTATCDNAIQDVGEAEFPSTGLGWELVLALLNFSSAATS